MYSAEGLPVRRTLGQSAGIQAMTEVESYPETATGIFDVQRGGKIGTSNDGGAASVSGV